MSKRKRVNTHTHLDSVTYIQHPRIFLNGIKYSRYCSLYVHSISSPPEGEAWFTYKELVSAVETVDKQTALKEAGFTSTCFESATALETSHNSLCSPVCGNTQ